MVPRHRSVASRRSNNWQFFRLLVQMGLERVDVAFDRDAHSQSVELLDSFAIADGWYTDGSGGNIDYYVPFAFHTYGLVLAASGLGDRAAAARYVERARAFAGQFRHWFAADGGALPFGRSLTYRMAQGSFWGALALADVDALEWAEVRGLALRHLRWWSERPISDRDGVLSVGYGYDNRRMAESYNSAGSPYWCMKAFTMLAAPDDHPFWTVEEAAPDRPITISLRTPGMVLGHDDGQVVGLFAQPPGWSFVEQADAKYQKFAYSSRFGFSGDFTMYGLGATDSMLAVTDPASGVRRVREGVLRSEVVDGTALSEWSPMPGVHIGTALAGRCAVARARPPHRDRTRGGAHGDRLRAALGTGGVCATAARPRPSWASATMTSAAGATTVVDRPQRGRTARDAELYALSPNANVMHPHTVVAALTTTVPPGCHWLACAVGASHEAGRVLPEQAPELDPALVEQLEALPRRRRLRRDRDARAATGPHHPRHLRGPAAVHGRGRGRLAGLRIPAHGHGRRRTRSRRQHGHRVCPTARARATRARVLECAAHASGPDGFVAGAFVADDPGESFRPDAYADAIAAITIAGGTPVIFPSYGLNSLDDADWVAAHDEFGRCCDRFIGFELGPMFVPYGRIYSLDAYEGLLGVASCIGAKHSSLSRAAEWDRLALRDRVRPDFHVFTGNDLAIDMVCYGSDYLLGLSAFAPEAFAERDRRWADERSIVPRAQRPAPVPRRVRVPCSGPGVPPRCGTASSSCGDGSGRTRPRPERRDAPTTTVRCSPTSHNAWKHSCDRRRDRPGEAAAHDRRPPRPPLAARRRRSARRRRRGRTRTVRSPIPSRSPTARPGTRTVGNRFAVLPMEGLGRRAGRSAL